MTIHTQEFSHAALGVPGRMFNRIVRQDKPELFASQTWTSTARPAPSYGKGAVMRVEMRYDDNCKNGHHTFAITATVTAPTLRATDKHVAGGCLHDDIALLFPEFAPVIPFHLCSSDGPMHYIANTLHFAGDRDCWGLRKGEKRARTNRDGQPLWELVAVNSLGVAISDTPTGLEYTGAETVPLYLLRKDHAGERPPATPRLEWRPSYSIGDGKERELDAARRAAIWPDAPDYILTGERAELVTALNDRLPGLICAFRHHVEACGFAWQP